MLFFLLCSLLLQFCDAAGADADKQLLTAVTIGGENYTGFEPQVTDAFQSCSSKSSNSLLCTSKYQYRLSGVFFSVIGLNGDQDSYEQCIQADLGSISNVQINFTSYDPLDNECKTLKDLMPYSFKCYDSSICSVSAGSTTTLSASLVVGKSTTSISGTTSTSSVSGTSSTAPPSLVSASTTAPPSLVSAITTSSVAGTTSSRATSSPSADQAKVQSDLSAVEAAVDAILSALADLKSNSGSLNATTDVLNALSALEDSNSNLFASLASLARVNATLRKRSDDGPFGPFVSQIALNATGQQATALNGLTQGFSDITSNNLASDATKSGISYANTGSKFLTTYGLTCSAGGLNSAISNFNAISGSDAPLVNEDSSCAATTSGATSVSSTTQVEASTTQGNGGSATVTLNTVPTSTTLGLLTETAIVGNGGVKLRLSLVEVALIGLGCIL